MTDQAQQMLRQVLENQRRLEVHTRVATAMARASLTRSLQPLNPADPNTWEFSGFSQHGEDGITEHLTRQLTHSNEFFIEIGAADGTQNCTAWLAFARQYFGIMVEGNQTSINQGRDALQELNWAVRYVAQLVDPSNVAALMKLCPFSDPDVFSLDIDGIDFHIARAVLELGIRPKIFILEYNANFGPQHAVAVPYQPGFERHKAHTSGLYYGASVMAYRVLLAKYGYDFLTTERSGTNAFFVHSSAFPPGYARGVKGVDFRMNHGDQNGATQPIKDSDGDWVVRRVDWQARFEMIKHLPLIHVDQL
jgi:hypothetical protein